MKLTYKQRLQQAVIFFSTCDESIVEVANLFQVHTVKIQKAYNASYNGRYSY